MLQRWAVAALLRAEKRFKRVKGYREIPNLLLLCSRKILTERRLQPKIMQSASFLLQLKEGTTSGGGKFTNYGAKLSQEFEIAGQRGLRIDIAEKDLSRISLDIKDKE